MWTMLLMVKLDKRMMVIRETTANARSTHTSITMFLGSVPTLSGLQARLPSHTNSHSSCGAFLAGATGALARHGEPRRPWWSISGVCTGFTASCSLIYILSNNPFPWNDCTENQYSSANRVRASWACFSVRSQWGRSEDRKVLKCTLVTR